MEWLFLATAAMTLLAIIHPLGALSLFVSLTAGMDRAVRLEIARRAVITSGAILLLFHATGALVLEFFGISFAAFRIAGGLLLASVAFELLMEMSLSGGQKSEEPPSSPEELAMAGVSPMGVPLLAGPGAITTVMLLGQTAPGRPEWLALAGVILLISLLTYLILRYAGFLFHLFGRPGLYATHRVMGLLIMAIAVQFIIDGSVEIWETRLNP